MKPTLTILSLFLSIHLVQAQTNVYQPYPLGDASWTVHRQISSASSWETKTWSGDTIINGETYIRVFDDPNMIGVRQDIPNEKVYYVDDQGIESDASFDQGAQIGDTVLMSLAFKKLNMFSEGVGIGDDLAVIQSIDSTLIGPLYHKTFSFTVITGGIFFDGKYICGVSCTEAITSISSAFDLVCYYVEGQQFLGDPFNPECTANVGELPKGYISIYPNPSDGFFFIEYDKSASLLGIHLLDLTGKRIGDFNKNNAETGFDISNLSSGTYLVELVFENGSARSTLIRR